MIFAVARRKMYIEIIGMYESVLPPRWEKIPEKKTWIVESNGLFNIDVHYKFCCWQINIQEELEIIG